MVLKTCLLISSDPDDHIEFTEALYEIANDVVVMTITHPDKAVDLLKLKRLVPDFIIVDLSPTEWQPEDLFDAIQDDKGLQKIPLIAYGEFSDLERVQNAKVSAFLNNSFSYSGLRNALSKLVAANDGQEYRP